MLDNKLKGEMRYEIKNQNYVLRSSNDGSRDYDRRSIERTRSGRYGARNHDRHGERAKR
jgi:hypothetical protein